MISAAAAITSAAVRNGAAAIVKDANFSKVSLLMGFEGPNNSTTFVDESANNATVTVNGSAKIDTAQFKFGTSSLLCTTAATDYIQVPDSTAFTMGSGDFTLECFWQPLVGGNHYIMGQGTAGGFAWNIMMVESGSLRWGQRDFAQVYEATSGFTIVVGQKYHLVIERSGTVARLYRDGAMVFKATIGSGAMTDATDPWRIGLGWPGVGTSAHIDEVRVTKGLARYNSDSGYTVPIAAFPRS